MPRKGNDPALELGFSSVSFDVPAASTFTFTPPKGVKVTDQKVPSTAGPKRVAPKQTEPKQTEPKKPGTATQDKPTVIGEGWESVAMIRGAETSGLTGNGMLAQLLAKAPTVQGTWGKGKVVTSKMVSALITDDGRVFVGLVTPDTLQAAAAKAPR